MLCGGRAFCRRQTLATVRYCTTNIMDSSCGIKLAAKEVRFPVPWGHIAGREWGDPEGRHVLTLHGWLDNAGSFDSLIPLLSPSLHVVAIDLPGHGQSSHRPPGSFYHAYNYIADVKYVIDALKWGKFSFLAHSMGAGVASWFSAALPELVECLVLVEGFGYFPTALEDLPGRMGKALRELNTLDAVDNKFYSSWDEVVDRMHDGHLAMDPSFSREAAAALSVRGSRQVEDNRYQFTRDLRVKAPSLLRIPACVNSAFTSNVQCPVLLITAEKSLLPSRVFNSMASEQLPKQLKVIRVAGGHHVHLCQPEVLYKAVDCFLCQQTLHPDFQEISKL